MTTLSRDTAPHTERIQLELLRRMPPWRRLELVSQLTQMSYTLTLAGLRHRHPQASEQELHRRLAEQWLGSELATRVYGPLHQEEE